MYRSGLPLLIKVLSFMAVAAPIAVEERSVQARMASPSRFGDKAFEWLTLAMALAVVVLIILIGWQLWIGSSVAIKIRFSFPCHVNLGPGCRTIWRVALYLRNPGFLADCPTDCGSLEYRNGSVPDRACASVDSAAARFPD